MNTTRYIRNYIADLLTLMLLEKFLIICFDLNRKECCNELIRTGQVCTQGTKKGYLHNYISLANNTVTHSYDRISPSALIHTTNASLSYS